MLERANEQLTLTLHVGMGKAGSSALQVAFARNSHRLSEIGVHYPRAASFDEAVNDGVTSGNGMTLARYVTGWLQSPGEKVDQHLEAVLREACDAAERGNSVVLYSSEFLWEFSESRLRVLTARARRLGFAVRFIVCVRNVAPHALSTYAQRVRRGGLSMSFGTFVQGKVAGAYDPQTKERIQVLFDVVGSANVCVIHYDSVREHLTETVLGIGLGLASVQLVDLDLVQRDINRSLTQPELALLQEVFGRVASPRERARAADALVSLEPWGQHRRWISPHDADVLRARFDPDVSWLNELPMVGGCVSLLGGLDIEDREESPLVLTDSERHLLDWLIRLVEQPSRE